MQNFPAGARGGPPALGRGHRVARRAGWSDAGECGCLRCGWRPELAARHQAARRGRRYGAAYGSHASGAGRGRGLLSSGGALAADEGPGFGQRLVGAGQRARK